MLADRPIARYSLAGGEYWGKKAVDSRCSIASGVGNGLTAPPASGLGEQSVQGAHAALEDL